MKTCFEFRKKIMKNIRVKSTRSAPYQKKKGYEICKVHKMSRFFKSRKFFETGSIWLHMTVTCIFRRIVVSKKLNGLN